MITISRTFTLKCREITWHPPLEGTLTTLECSLCHRELGNRAWAMAWVETANSGYSARLCQECGKSTPVDAVSNYMTEGQIGKFANGLRIFTSDHVPEDSVVINRASFERYKQSLEP